MSKGGHHHYVASLALHEVTHITKFCSRGNEVVEKDIIRAFSDPSFKTQPLAQTRYVGGIGMRYVGHSNDIVVNGHACGREFGGVGSRYHIDAVAQHTVVIDDMGIGITLHNIRYTVILHKVVNQP